MSATLPNGKPRPTPAQMIELPGHNGFLIRMSDEDPGAEVDTTIRPCDIIPQIREFEARREAMPEELHSFQKAMEHVKRENRRSFVNWKEVLETIHALGYRKVAASTLALDPPAEAKC